MTDTKETPSIKKVSDGSPHYWRQIQWFHRIRWSSLSPTLKPTSMIYFPTQEIPKKELLIRGTIIGVCPIFDRDSAEIERLSDVIRRCTPIGQKTLDLKATEKRAPRQAVLNLKTTSVEIQPPKNHPHFKTLNPIKVTVILAEEESPPPDVEPVNWL
jgi:hypothetical protein